MATGICSWNAIYLFRPSVMLDEQGLCLALDTSRTDIFPHRGGNLTVPLFVYVMGGAFSLGAELATCLRLANRATVLDSSIESYDLSGSRRGQWVKHDVLMTVTG